MVSFLARKQNKKEIASEETKNPILVAATGIEPVTSSL